MKTWLKLSRAGKLAASITAIIVLGTTVSGIAWATYSYFQTDLEAETAREKIVIASAQAREEIIVTHEQDQVSQSQARKNDRIDRNQMAIDDYERDLLDPELPQREIDFINRKMQKLETKIQNIREGKE